MGIFASRTRTPAVVPEAREDLTERERMGLPSRFEVVGEALASGAGSVDACAVVGRELAMDGASLEEVLEGLRVTYQTVLGTTPDYPDVVAISVAWSEATLGYMHQLSCEDPLTGLASLAHVRSRLCELYRGQSRAGAAVRDSHALVVADLPGTPAELALSRSGINPGQRQRLTRALHLSRLGECARTVFSGTEVIGRLGPNRIVVIAARDERLGKRVALFRKLIGTLSLDGQATRVWIEGLPSVDATAASLLDELARP